jgi:hypothetical protein
MERSDSKMARAAKWPAAGVSPKVRVSPCRECRGIMTATRYSFTHSQLSAEEGGGYRIEYRDLPAGTSDGQTVEEAMRTVASRAQNGWRQSTGAASRYRFTKLSAPALGGS